jgi:REP element-mobilizing transposase RayT
MPRPQRIEYKGAWYHVLNRREGRRLLFGSDENRIFFLELLHDVSETYGIEVHAYCFTDQFFHLIVHTPHGNLSTAMRHINSVYTQQYNRNKNIVGSIFHDRYKAVLLEADYSLNRVSRYIHTTPEQVKNLKSIEQYKWSSYRAYTGKVKAPTWLHCDTILTSFGASNHQQKYKTFVDEGVDEETRLFYSKKSLFSIYGSKQFVVDAKAVRTGNRPSARLKQGFKSITKPRLTSILQATATEFSVDRKSLNKEMRGRGGGNTPRAVAMLIARSPGGYTLNEIAQALKIGDISTVSIAVKRIKNKITSDSQLARRVSTIRSSLFE